MRRSSLPNSSAPSTRSIPAASISVWGRAPGGDFSTMRALRRGLGQTGDEFAELLDELRTYLSPVQPGQSVKAFRGRAAMCPSRCSAPAVTARSWQRASACLFAFAAHFAPDYLHAAADLYRRNFKPSATLAEPYFIAAVQIIVAETDAAARRLSPHAAAAFPASHPQPAGRASAAGRFHELALVRLGSVPRSKANWARPSLARKKLCAQASSDLSPPQVRVK